MTGFAEQMRAGDGACRRGLWLTFLSPFGLELALSLGQKSVLDDAVVPAIVSVLDRTRQRGRIAGIFTGNRELTGLLPAVDLLGVDTDAAALRAGLKLMFGRDR